MNNLKHTHTISLNLGPALFPHTHMKYLLATWNFNQFLYHPKLEFLRGKLSSLT